MYSVSAGAASAATPALPQWAETLLAINNATGVVEWLPFLILAAGLLWLARVEATRPRAPETLNERSAREVEEGRR